MSELIIPPGKATGCLPRATRFGTCCDKLEDRMDVITSEDTLRSLIGTVGLRPRLDTVGVYDQNGFGSCATESTTASWKLSSAESNRDFIELNPLSIYHFTSGGSDRGSNIDRNLEYARDVGILPESVWPRSKGFRAKIPQSLIDDHAGKYRIREFWDCGTIDEVRTSLALGFPVVFGWRSHSCCLIELKNMSTAYYLNSWGADWGDNGVGEIALRSINFGYGAFSVRSVTDPGGTA